MKTKTQKIIATTLTLFFVMSGNVSAFTITNDTKIPNQGSFVVGPAKTEIVLSPGETKNVGPGDGL